MSHLIRNQQPGVKEKRSAATTKVYQDHPEKRAEQSAIFKGRQITWAAKIAETLTGHVRTEESRAKQSASMKGVPKSLEHKAAIAAATRVRYAKAEEHKKTSDAVKEGIARSTKRKKKSPE